MLAPICIFAFKRKDHLEQTVEALKKNSLSEQSHVLFFSDAAQKPGDKESVQEVRNYLRTIRGFKSTEIIERNENFGLSKNIIDGVTSVIHKYSKAIVLEDDMVTSPAFLDYMNDSLDRYENTPQVASIHAYIYPLKNKSLPSLFFLRGADCWGWATWKRAWDIYENNGQKLLNQIESQNLENQFDFESSYPYTEMLRKEISGELQSWAVKWYASAFLKNMLTLYPSQSFVRNVGLDGSGTHKDFHSRLDVKLSNEISWNFPEDIRESKESKQALVKYFKSITQSKKQRFLSFIGLSK